MGYSGNLNGCQGSVNLYSRVNLEKAPAFEYKPLIWNSGCGLVPVALSH